MKRLFLVFLTSMVPSIGGAFEVKDAYLTIGQGWAVVRETRMVDLKKGMQDLLIEGLPPSTDLSSLRISAQRFKVALTHWERKPSGKLPGPHEPAFRLVNEGRDIRWEPGGQNKPEVFPTSLNGPVLCRIDSSTAGRKTMDIMYKVLGFDWDAKYEVGIRGNPALDQASSSSVSLKIRMLIENKTTRSFSNCVVRLVGFDRASETGIKTPPGFLLHNTTSPLRKLWQGEKAAPQPAHAYPIEKRISLKSNARIEIPFLKLDRARPKYIYRMSSSFLPDGSLGRHQAFRQFMVLGNSTANGMGYMLPPGTVDVYEQGGRRTLLRTGRLTPTGVGDEIRMDLGVSGSVRGTRKSIRRTDVHKGWFEETFEVIVVNDQGNRVAVEIIEEPPLSLEWNFLRSNTGHEQIGHRILLKTEIQEKSRHTIRYEIATHQPGFESESD